MDILQISPYSLPQSPEMNERVSDAVAAFKGIHLKYPPHELFHSELDRVRLTGLKTRGYEQSGIRALGPSGSGKTTAAKSYMRWLLRQFPPKEGFVPVVYLELDPGASGKQVLSAILAAYDDPFCNKGTEATLRPRVWEFVRRFGTQLIILDEVQHLKFTYNRATNITDSIKKFLDGGLVPIALIGVDGADGAEPLFEKSIQLNSRLLVSKCFKPMETSAFNLDLFSGYVRSLEAAISDLRIFRNKCAFSSPQCMACLYEVANGVMGRVSRIMLPALTHAVMRDADSIELTDLSHAVDTFAIPNKYCQTNPFIRKVQQ